MVKNILEIENLKVVVPEGTGTKTLVNDLSFNIGQERIVSLVGGSGSGKTTTGLAILRLLPPALSIRKGAIKFYDQDLLKYSKSKMRSLRGKDISMVFQEPLDAFNPVFRIGYQIEEVLSCHTKLRSKQRKEKVLYLLKTVGIKDPKRVAANYPHQLSGGMRQRAMIAQAIAVDPKLIIADEPTSNLDVTLQAKIIELFQRLRDELHLSILLITHDLGVVKHLADDVAVLFKGKIVEQGKTKEVIDNPKHEFTKNLLKTIEL